MVGGMRAALVTAFPAGYHASAHDWHIVIAVVLETHLDGLVFEAFPACTAVFGHDIIATHSVRASCELGRNSGFLRNCLFRSTHIDISCKQDHGF